MKTDDLNILAIESMKIEAHKRADEAHADPHSNASYELGMIDGYSRVLRFLRKNRDANNGN